MPDTAQPDDRLDSWKEIAAYLKRDVTTVQRWERREGMPVHRHLHDRLGSVYAFRADLDAWSRQRSRGVQQDDRRAATEERPAETSRVGSAPRSHVAWPLATAALVAVLAAAAVTWLLKDMSAREASPLGAAVFQTITDFEGTEDAAAISRDGRLIAFLSDRDGQPDVWMTQVGTGRFYNLTRGRFKELQNPLVRTLGFSPDGALVTFWTRGASGSGGADVGIWAVPALGGEPRPYLEGSAEYDWSADGTQLVHHTSGPGDPMFVTEPRQAPPGREIFAALPGIHAHFVLWSPERRFVYFVQGAVPDALDIWRIPAGGGTPERLTHHNSRVSHPVMLDPATLLYLATDPEGDGPWLHSLDIDRGVTRRLSSSIERYTSLSASSDGRRLVASLASPKQTFWRWPLSAESETRPSSPSRLPVASGRGFSPGLGPGYLLYASSRGTDDVIWKLSGDTATELWTAPGARILGGLAVAPDGNRLAFCAKQGNRTRLHVLNADGTGASVLAGSLAVGGSPAWAPDGRTIAVAAEDGGGQRLFAVPLDGRQPRRLTNDYAADPAWSPDGRLIVYSGPDVGTRFPVAAVSANGEPRAIPGITLTRGARRLRFLPGGHQLVLLRGDIQHKDIWTVDLDTGAERALIDLPRDFHVRDFDVSPDGREIVVERVQEQADILLGELPRR